MDSREEKKLHEAIDLLGLRAHATAVGFIQLSIELNRAGILDNAALDRIKESIVRDLGLSRPASVSKEDFDRRNRDRLGKLFAGVGEIAPPVTVEQA